MPRSSRIPRPLALTGVGRRVAQELESLDRATLRDGAGYRAVAVALCTAAVSLMLLRYFGSTATFASVWSQRASITGDRQLDGFLYWSLACVMCYVALPVATMRIFGLGGARDAGLAWAGFHRHVHVYVAMLLPVLAGIVVVSESPEFQSVYPFYKLESGSARGLLAFELLYAFQFVALEFFFRGYLVHVPKRKLGAGSVFMMALPYCMLHFQKPLPEAAASVVGGLALGFVSLRTGSILGGCLIHVLVAWSMDAMSLYRQGKLDALIVALF